MQISICSYSFHWALAAGKHDMFQFIKDCKTLGCTQLDPWNGHFAVTKNAAAEAGDLEGARKLAEEDAAYLKKVKTAGAEAGLPFGCVAVDGCHIYEPSREKRKQNRARAYQWLAIAGAVGATQVRMDCGGTEDPADEVFDVIAEGYADVVKHAEQYGIQVLMENHWGPSIIPQNVVRIMEATPKLRLLLDSYNWKSGKQGEGWIKCAKYAACTHIKAFYWTPDGKQELTQNTQGFVDHMKASGYKGTWGIESCPMQREALDEMEGARRTVDLIRRCVG